MYFLTQLKHLSLSLSHSLSVLLPFVLSRLFYPSLSYKSSPCTDDCVFVLLLLFLFWRGARSHAFIEVKQKKKSEEKREDGQRMLFFFFFFFFFWFLYGLSVLCCMYPTTIIIIKKYSPSQCRKTWYPQLATSSRKKHKGLDLNLSRKKKWWLVCERYSLQFIIFFLLHGKTRGIQLC